MYVPGVTVINHDIRALYNVRLGRCMDTDVLRILTNLKCRRSCYIATCRWLLARVPSECRTVVRGKIWFTSVKHEFGMSTAMYIRPRGWLLRARHSLGIVGRAFAPSVRTRTGRVNFVCTVRIGKVGFKRDLKEFGLRAAAKCRKIQL